MRLPPFAALITLLPTVIAHGWMNSIMIDGTNYTGPAGIESNTLVDNPNKDASVIRQIANLDVVNSVSSPDMACGVQAKHAPKEAPARPGSLVKFTWISDHENWIHDTGAILIYMAKCEPDCTEFDASNAKWFKIDQMAIEDESTPVWWMATLNTGKPLSVTLPDNLAPGHYLFRSELIALHSADGAEFYPACAQLNVSESKAGASEPNTTVTFPGAYSLDDKGIKIHGQPAYASNINYKFPGGPVSNIRAKNDSAHAKDLTADFSPAHSLGSNSSEGVSTTAVSDPQSAAVTGTQSSSDGTVTMPSPVSSAATASTASADGNDSNLASQTTAGLAAAKTTCASTEVLAQRKRRSDRHRRAVDVVNDLRMAQAPHHRRWNW